MRQVLAAFRSGGATILEGDVMLVHANYVMYLAFCLHEQISGGLLQKFLLFIFY